MTFQHSILYWGIIVLVGLTTGGASGVYFSGATSTEVNNEPTPVNQEQLNLRNPDFGQIRNLFREGQYDQVESRLSTLHQNSPNPTIRAKALYFRYVFQQQQGNYQRSLELAETFLQEFQNHPRRAEIAYGAWFLSTEMLNEPNQAERFKKLLQDEFPDTKWAERLSS
jgi:outer membrane protein assembly factor BamD (BamD/ComL family)